MIGSRHQTPHGISLFTVHWLGYANQNVLFRDGPLFFEGEGGGGGWAIFWALSGSARIFFKDFSYLFSHGYPCTIVFQPFFFSAKEFFW